MNRILLIIGNGFSIDLFQHLKSNIHPSSPFSFGILDPFDNSKKLLDTLTHVRKMVKSPPNTTDFNIIQDFVASYDAANQGHIRTHSELRQYLSLAYAYANDILLTHWKGDWRWSLWLSRHYKKVVGVVSFNYDLILETALEQSSLGYYRVGSTEEDAPTGISIFKPHGSCDFDISNKAISMSPEARLKNVTFLNDYVVNGRGRIDVVPKEKLSEPRTEADIVLPLEFSPQTQLTWVRQGYEAIKQIANTVDTCVIVGISYQPCDRAEIDSIIDGIVANAAIYLVVPRPNKEFEEKLLTVSDKSKRITPRDFFNDIA